MTVERKYMCKDTLMILKFMKLKLLIECLVSLFSCFLESGDRF